MSSNAEVLVEAGIAQAAEALGVPRVLVPLLVDAFKAIAHAPDVEAAARRVAQNALADAEDLVAEEAAVALNKAAPPKP